MTPALESQGFSMQMVSLPQKPLNGTRGNSTPLHNLSRSTKMWLISSLKWLMWRRRFSLNPWGILECSHSWQPSDQTSMNWSLMVPIHMRSIPIVWITGGKTKRTSSPTFWRQLQRLKFEYPWGSPDPLFCWHKERMWERVWPNPMQNKSRGIEKPLPLSEMREY